MKKETSTLTKRLAQYSALAAPMLALGSAANAQVNYTDVDPDFVLIDSTAGDNLGPLVSLDLDNDGVFDLQIIVWSSLSLTNGFKINLAAARQYGSGNGILGYISTGGPFYYPSALNYNDPVGSNGDFWAAPGTNSFGTLVWYYIPGGGGAGVFGQWDDAVDKYMGAQFVGGDGGLHYAWLRMDVANNPVSITLKDFAFDETPNLAIPAGETGNIAVPQVNAGNHISIVAFEKNVFITAPNVSGDQMTIAVTDLLGKTILNQETKETTVRLSLNDLASGMYLVTVQKGTEQRTSKVSIR